MMHHRRQIGLLALLGMLAWYSSILLFGDDDYYYEIYEEEHRSLRVDHFLNPQTNTLLNMNTTLTIYLTSQGNPADSIFKTDMLQRHGSGKFNYIIQINSPCDRSCKLDDSLQELREMEHSAPCLAVSIGTRWSSCKHYELRCTYPACKTMVTNDERCQVQGYDVREYFTSTQAGKGYLPLGPRLDSWTSLRKLQSEPNFAMKTPSQRKYAFNAIFSKDTDKGRQKLAKIINGHRVSFTNMIRPNNTSTEYPVFAKMASHWTSKVNSPHSEQLDTDSTMKVMLDSIFTLAPGGHNPECFRLYESIEAGSIPIVLRGDLYKSRFGCKNSLAHWVDSPIVAVNSWYELYDTVTELLANVEELDRRQREMMDWYGMHMKKTVGEFEQYLIDSYGRDGQLFEVEREETVNVSRFEVAV